MRCIRTRCPHGRARAACGALNPTHHSQPPPPETVPSVCSLWHPDPLLLLALHLLLLLLLLRQLVLLLLVLLVLLLQRACQNFGSHATSWRAGLPGKQAHTSKGGGFAT